MREGTFYRFVTYGGLLAAALTLGGGPEALLAQANPLLNFHLVEPYEPDKFIGKSDKALNLTKTPVYCPATAFEAPGQAWSVGLTSGGVTFEASTRYGNKTVEPKLSNIELPVYNQKSRAASIIVVDHFTKLQLKLDEDGPGNKPVIKDFYLRHGDLVIAHMRSLLEEAGYVYSSSSPSANIPIILKRGSDVIRIHRLDIGNPNASSEEIEKDHTSILQNRLDSFFKDDSYTQDHILVNMSFALIPCKILINYREIREKWYGYNKRYTFNEYIKDLKKLNPRIQGDIEGIITNVPNDESFKKWFDKNIPEYRRRSKITLIASSSNFGLNFSTAPASWKDVISVGAIDKNWQQVFDIDSETGKNHQWSSTSDIQTIGEWFKFSIFPNQIQNYCTNGGNCIADDIKANKGAPPLRYNNFAYRGTSFSAPSVTAFLATLDVNSPCFKNAGLLGYNFKEPGLTIYKPLSKGKNLPFKNPYASVTCQ